jgi:outer membrane protein TolC
VRHLTFALFGILMTATASLAQDAPTLTLDEAIRLGLAQNRTVANAALQVEKDAHDVSTARSRRLPRFNVETQASQLLQPIDLTFPRGSFGTFDGLGPIPANDAVVSTPSKLTLVSTLQASQPLTQLLKLNLNVQLSEATKARDEQQLRDTQLALVGEIKRAYYDIVQTRSALAANTRSIDLLQEMSRVVATRVAQQVALKSDALETESRLARAELTRLELTHAIASRKEQLNQLLGRDVRTTFDVTELPAAAIRSDIDLADAQARAIEVRPDVKQARLRVEQAELARRVSKADYVPDVSLAVSYITPINMNGAPQHIATAGVQLQWEPFDWGRRSRALAAKGLELRQAENAVHETEDRAALDVSSRFRAVETARARLKAARLAGDAAHETARIRLMQYGTQAALFADVLQTQSAAADADHQFQQALAAFWSAQADFERAMAEDIQQ